MTKNGKPQLWVIAGTNGSGKSSFIRKYAPFLKEKVPVINPDEIALQIDPSNPTPVARVQALAGRKSIELQRRYINQRKSFAIETTLSGNQPVRLIEQAKKNGFKTNLVYISLPDPHLNISRVEERTQKGGHNIPTEDILRRYTTSRENFRNCYKSVDKVLLVDNTLHNPKIHAVIRKGEIVKSSLKPPKHLVNLLPEIASAHKKQKGMER